jgi:hypothetical protein
MRGPPGSNPSGKPTPKRRNKTTLSRLLLGILEPVIKILLGSGSIGCTNHPFAKASFPCLMYFIWDNEPMKRSEISARITSCMVVTYIATNSCQRDAK